MKTFLVFLFSIHIVVESVWQNPGFCGTYECPEYTLDEQGKSTFNVMNTVNEVIKVWRCTSQNNKEDTYVYTIRWDKYVAAKKRKLKMGKLQSSSIFVIDSGDNIAGYEKRFYATATWVSTSAAGSYKNATTTTFSKLQSYLKQLNAEAMAVPYVTMMFPTVGLNVVQNFTQFFFIKPSLRPAPEPIDTSIQLKVVPPKHLYIRTVPIHVTSTADWVKQANLLASSINDTSKYYGTFFFTAEYNLPSESGKRYSEVWFYAMN